MLTVMVTRITKFAVLLLLFAGAYASSGSADDREQSQQFFNTYCVSCHGQNAPKAGLRLDHVDPTQWNDPTLLDDIYTAIESGEMPPGRCVKTSKVQRVQSIAEGIRQSIAHARRKAETGNAETIESESNIKTR